jgi:hypothetical protein
MYNPSSSLKPKYFWELVGSGYRLLSPELKKQVEAIWSGLILGAETTYFNGEQAYSARSFSTLGAFIEHHGVELNLVFKTSGSDKNTEDVFLQIPQKPTAVWSENSVISSPLVYAYKVAAKTPYGQTLLSQACFVTIDSSIPLSDTETITVSWPAVAGATGYDVYRAQGTSFKYVGSSASTQFSDQSPVALDTLPIPTKNAALVGYLYATEFTKNLVFLEGVLDSLGNAVQVSTSRDGILFPPNAYTRSGDNQDFYGGLFTTQAALTIHPAFAGYIYPEDAAVVYASGYYPPHVSGWAVMPAEDKLRMWGNHFKNLTTRLVQLSRGVPSLEALQDAWAFALNTPYAEEDGVVTVVGANYITISGVTSYTYHLGTPPIHTSGNTVSKFEFLVQKPEVQDFIVNPSGLRLYASGLAQTLSQPVDPETLLTFFKTIDWAPDPIYVQNFPKRLVPANLRYAVNPPSPAYSIIDADALDYLTKVELTDDYETAQAVDLFTLGVKADGLWNKVTCMHLYLGGTAYRHSLDLKTRGEGTNTSQILWLDGGLSIEHSSLGSKGDLTSTSYGIIQLDTTPLTADNSSCYGFYVEKTTTHPGIVMGQVGGSPSFNGSYSSFLNGTSSARIRGNQSLNFTQSQTKGFVGIGRMGYAGNNTSIIHPEGITRGNTNTTGDTGGVGNSYKVSIMRRFSALVSSSYSDDWIRFTFVGTGFSEADMLLLKARVITLQTALGRA